jgi:uncharacterized membrane protein
MAHSSRRPTTKRTGVIRALTSLEAIYVLSGAALLVVAVCTFADRTHPARLGSGLFWGSLGITFVLGSVLPAWLIGLLVIGMALLDGFGLVRPGVPAEPTPEERMRAATRFGWRIVVPVLMIPAGAYGASLIPWGAGVGGDRVVFVSLGYAAILAAIVALLLTRARPVALIHEGRRLAEAIGAVVILPQLLAALGTLFTTAGVGRAIAQAVQPLVPADSPFAVVLVCCAGIAALTFVMGNSFAAFPVIMAGLAIPLLVRPFAADPAIVGAILLTCASCGTLCTPMAANFNLVPASLLEMRDPNGAIRFQAPYAAAMFVAHVLLLWVLIAFVR